jgi:hypothetical protein
MNKYQNNDLKNILDRLRDIREELFEKGYINSNKMVAELGECFASKILNLKLNKKNNEKDYDAIDSNGKKVQIKARQSHKRNIGPYVYRGFSNIEYDYALLIELDENYWVEQIWKISKENIKKYRTKNGTINFLKSRKDKIGTKVYP